MAFVLDAFASYVTDLIKQVVQDEVGMMLGVSGEIASLDEKLQSLKDFLADAERRRITDRSVQGWVRKLKGVMYDATDILDLCELRAMDRRQGTGCCNPLLFCLRHPLFAHDIGSRIKELNQRLDDICKTGAAFNFIKLETFPVSRPRPSTEGRKTDPVLDQSSVVGEKIQEDTRALVERLVSKVEGKEEIMVVAIVGVGGIGKTTLAKNVFNDDTIQHDFGTKIWLSVTQEFSEAALLKTAITTAEGVLPGDQDRAVLVPALVKTITGKKFFLVLDDVWSDREWNNLLMVPFSHGAPGSRVLVTTRDERVARGMKAREPFHRVDKLDDGDAWSLLKKQVVSSERDELAIDMLKDVGMEIVSKCDGLPLAIKVMGGLLCQREKRRSDWEKVLHDSIWSVSEMPQELNNAIYLSYEDLSPCLKQCFLHYSILPRSTIFSDDTIVGMWISEGFVHASSDKLEELGKEYYRELISRNLIEPDAKYIASQVCNMHDVVRSFAQYVARDEALVAYNGKTKILGELKKQTFLRLSIRTGVQPDEFEWRFLREQKSLRTLISIGDIKTNPGDSLFTFTSLRTLHIECSNFATFVESLYQLKHLRYLFISCSDISSLPDNIGKMKFLQHINVRYCENLVKLPKSIIKLRNLTYLFLNNNAVYDIPRGFHGLTNLRTLNGFRAHSDGDWCSLEEVGPLAQLNTLGLYDLQNVRDASFAKKAKLSEKVCLTQLLLCCDTIVVQVVLALVGEQVSNEAKQRIEKVYDELCPPSCIDCLDIDGFFGRRLPNWLMSSTEPMAPVKNLRILSMNNLAYCTQLPDGLCKLPCLELLQIDGAPAIRRVGSEFQWQLHHHHPAFPKLHEMNLKGMVEWAEWDWEKQINMQTMPLLEKLKLQVCKLRHLPPGLAYHATALKKLYIYEVQHLNSIENFPSVVELHVSENPNLERIANIRKLQELIIVFCSKMKTLEGVPALRKLVLEDYCIKRLPTFLKDVNPRQLQLDCSLELLTLIAMGQSSVEWNKFSHIQQVQAYANEGNNRRKWYVQYMKKDLSYNLETNIPNNSSARS